MTINATALKARVSVPETLALLGHDLPPNRKIPCFLHDGDNTPSLHVYDDHWFSFCCGTGGDVFDLLIGLKVASNFQQAVVALDTLVGSELDERPVIEVQKREVKDFTSEFMAHSLPHLNHAQSLMKAKGWHRLFSAQDLLSWGVRASTTHLLIPHHHDGRVVVGVKTRRLTTGEKMAWTGSTFSLQPYIADSYQPLCDVAVICEGESDAWALTAYYDRTVAVFALPSGAGSWKPAWADTWLSGYEEVWLMLDNDRAGDEAAKKVQASVPRAVRVDLPENDVVETLLEGWRLPRP